MLLLANSLVDGFIKSNLIGQGIVVAQLLTSVLMVAVAIGKFKELGFLRVATHRFQHDFSSEHDILGYYFSRRPGRDATALEGIYAQTCERLLKLLTPDIRAQLLGHNGAATMSALTAHEVELVKGTCEHALDAEEIKLSHGMTIIATVVALAPMLGLLGTVWGVLDAFAEMGTAGSANLATIAPSISAALVTTVVGLLIAIPGVICFNCMTSIIRDLSSDMEAFVDELMGRIACEFQGHGA